MVSRQGVGSIHIVLAYSSCSQCIQQRNVEAVLYCLIGSLKLLLFVVKQCLEDAASMVIALIDKLQCIIISNEEKLPCAERKQHKTFDPQVTLFPPSMKFTAVAA